MQFSASSSLSKDPKVKMEQIEKLLSMNVVDQSMAATLLEMPDLEGAYSIATAAYNANEKIIERVIEQGPDPVNGFTYFECTDVRGLFKQAVNMLLRLDASDEKPEVLQRLVDFITKVKTDIDALGTAESSLATIGAAKAAGIETAPEGVETAQQPQTMPPNAG